MATSFDKYASEYDIWFLANENVLRSEAALVAATLKDAPTPILSVGCGSGLFETILRDEYGINISDGVEPSAGMAEIAKLRGLNVAISTGEEYDFPQGKYSTVLFNGSPSYITDLETVVKKAHEALPLGGRIVLIDVPKESSYGLLYNLAKTLGTWEHPLLQGACPPNPYPIEFVKQANWRTSEEKLEILKKCGFNDIHAMQTLTTHPAYSDVMPEEPSKGCDKGDYVAIIATK
ncbi:MAG: class I SAM-dependent methyltransferase [Lachnospiraceae bacterium]|nr:class I SAM-dependent methyltransferase [Lachnospiraceae bacterium]